MLLWPRVRIIIHAIYLVTSMPELSGAQVVMFSGLHLSSTRIRGMIFIMKAVQWLQDLLVLVWI